MRRGWRQSATLVFGLSALLAIAHPQLFWRTGFEPPIYTGSPAGTLLTGQDRWQTVGFPFFVFTYTHNALGLPINPVGRRQFIGAEGEGHAPPPNALHEFPWREAHTWTISHDFCVGLPHGPVPQRIGGFSLEPAGSFETPSTRVFHLFFQWRAFDPGQGFDVFYGVYNADGTLQQPFPSPGRAWRRLQGDHWYRLRTTLDFTTNRIIRVSITDLTTGEVRVHRPPHWYLGGGAHPNIPLPTGLSFFVGFTPGPLLGNRLGVDNLRLVEVLTGM